MLLSLQATMEGFEVNTLANKVGQIDIFVTTTGNKDIIMVDDMRKMKNNAIVCNIGHVSHSTQLPLFRFLGYRQHSMDCLI